MYSVQEFENVVQVKSSISGSDVMCHEGLCYNDGVCEKQWNSYICNCDMTTFTGPRCAQGECP